MVGCPVTLLIALDRLCLIRQIQYEAVSRFFETRHRDLPGNVREAAAWVKHCMGMFFHVPSFGSCHRFLIDARLAAIR